MKRIFVLLLCLMLLLAVPVTAFAEGEITDVTETEGAGEDNSSTTEETPAEDEILPPETSPEETPEVVPEEDLADETPEENTGDGITDWNEVKDTISGAIKEWIEPNLEEIGVIITLIGYGIMLFKRLKTVLNSMGVLNNNAITIAKDSKTGMDNAASVINNVSDVISGWTEKIAVLLEAYQNKAEKEAALEKELVEIKNFLKTSTKANLEFANELADLIALANIPNYKKEELGSRHLSAVNAIIAAEEKAEAEAVAAAALLLPSTEEVKEDVGEEA